MAGPRPEDQYNPTPTVEPTTSAPNDYLSVRATPEAFGSQVGGALQQAGAKLEQTGQQGIDFAIQRQGLYNEHAANMAELQLATEGGKLADQYKSLQGFDAVNAKDQVVANYSALNDKIRNSLGNPAAQRTYDLLATRRMSYTIADFDTYAASQQKEAYKAGNVASMKMSESNAASAGYDDNRYGYEIGNIKHQAANYFTNPDYGLARSISVTQNKDGTLKFDTSTPQGAATQAQYDIYLKTEIGAALQGRVLAIADNPRSPDPVGAVHILEANKDSITPDLYKSIGRQLSGPFRNVIGRTNTDEIFNGFKLDFTGALQKPGQPVSVPQPLQDDFDAVISDPKTKDYATHLIAGENAGWVPNLTNRWGYAGLGQFSTDQWQKVTGQAIDKSVVGTPNDPRFNARATFDAINREADQNSKTLSSVGIAADPGNLALLHQQGTQGGLRLLKAPIGTRADSIVSQMDLRNNGIPVDATAQQAVERIKQHYGLLDNVRTPQAVNPVGNESPVTWADNLEANRGKLIDQARASVAQYNDPALSDATAQHMETRINTEIATIRTSGTALGNQVLAEVLKGSYTDPDQLSRSPVAGTWNQLQANYPLQANGIANIVRSGTRGSDKHGYGDEFYYYLSNYGDANQNHPLDIATAIDYNNLTGPGFKSITAFMDMQKTPQDHAFAQQTLDFLKKEEPNFTNGSVPAFNIAWSKASGILLDKVMQMKSTLEQEGKSTSSIFDPKNKDSIYAVLPFVPGKPDYQKKIRDEGLAAAAQTPIPTTQPIQNRANPNQQSTLDPNTIKNDLDLKKAVQEGRISRPQFVQVAIRLGILQDPNHKPPEVPKPQ